MEPLVERINCIAGLLKAVKDCFVQDRGVKDEIIALGTGILVRDLRTLKELQEA